MQFQGQRVLHFTQKLDASNSEFVFDREEEEESQTTKLATDQRLLGQMTDCIIHLLVSFRLVLVGSECSILRIVRLRKKDSGECIVRLRKKGSGECMYMKSGRVRVRVGVGELGVGEL